MADLHGQRVAQHLADQAADVVGHGGREKQCLAPLGHGLDDTPHIGQKAHVEHAVGLVQHEHLDAGQVHGALTDMIEKPAGAGHHNLRSGAQGLKLAPETNATVDGDAAQARLPTQDAKRLVNLLGQLARGRDDQCSHTAARALLETLKNGQRKSRRLAGAGLGQAHDVTPGHDGRDRLLLDRGRLDIAERGYARGNARAEVET